MNEWYSNRNSSQFVDCTMNFPILMSVSAFGAALRPFTDMPLVNAWRLSGTGSRIRRNLGNLVIQALLQGIRSIALIQTSDISCFNSVVALLTLNSVLNGQTTIGLFTRSHSVVLKVSPSQGPKLQCLSFSNSTSLGQSPAARSFPSSPSFWLRQVTDRYCLASPHFSEH